MYKKLPQELEREQWTKQGPTLLEIYVLTGPKPFSYKEAELELKLNNAELGKKHLQIKDNWSCRWLWSRGSPTIYTTTLPHPLSPATV